MTYNQGLNNANNTKNNILRETPSLNQYQTHMEEEEELPTERIVEHGVLRDPRTLVFRARREKRFIFSCPVDLRKYSITIRQILQPRVHQYAVVIVPTMLMHFWMNQKGSSSHQTLSPSRVRKASNRNFSMNLIIWNCSGAGNADFRRNFRSMIDYHMLSLVALLETKLTDHHNLVHDFGFTSLIKKPTNGNSGGIVLMWNN